SSGVIYPQTDLAANLPLRQGSFQYCADPWGKGVTCQLIIPQPWDVADVRCQWGDFQQGGYWSYCATAHTSGQSLSCTWQLRSTPESPSSQWVAGCDQKYGGAFTHSVYSCVVDIYPSRAAWQCRRF